MQVAYSATDACMQQKKHASGIKHTSTKFDQQLWRTSKFNTWVVCTSAHKILMRALINNDQKNENANQKMATFSVICSNYFVELLETNYHKPKQNNPVHNNQSSHTDSIIMS